MDAVLCATLAAVVGIAVVAIGGGGIAPMRQHWESTPAEVEAPDAERGIQNSGSAADPVRDEAQRHTS